MKSALICLAVMGTIGPVASTRGQTAAQQYQFAEHLEQTGELAFALLEFKRFAFVHSSDPKAASARLKIADIYFSYARSLDKGKAALVEVTKVHTNSPEAAEATKLLNFIEANKEAQDEPLLGVLDARRLASVGQADAAVKAYLAAAEKHPQSRVAATAMLEAGRLQLEALKQPDKAVATLGQVLRRYPNSPVMAEAQYLAAEAVEKAKGPGAEAIQAYEQVSPADSKNPYRVKALAAIERLRKAQNLPQRQLAKDLVRNFTLVRKAYAEDTYLLIVELPLGLQDNEIKATMEEALFKHVGERRDAKHKLKISAYFNYPLTEAGTLNWTPGQATEFAIAERKKEDVIKDVFFDLLKKR